MSKIGDFCGTGGLESTCKENRIEFPVLRLWFKYFLQSGSNRVVSLSKAHLGSVRVNTDRGVNTDGELQIPIKRNS